MDRLLMMLTRSEVKIITATSFLLTLLVGSLVITSNLPDPLNPVFIFLIAVFFSWIALMALFSELFRSTHEKGFKKMFGVEPPRTIREADIKEWQSKNFIQLKQIEQMLLSEIAESLLVINQYSNPGIGQIVSDLEKDITLDGSLVMLKNAEYEYKEFLKLCRTFEIHKD